MEYKRLTRRNTDGTTWVKCAICDIQDKCDFTKECCCQELQDRLAELEDKIENGTLVDTETYFIVEENQWAGKNRFLICKNGVQLETYDFCETREEAEKRLLELQGDKE